MNTGNGTAGVGGLRERRRALGLPQEDVARLADCSVDYVRLLERGFEPRYSDVLPRIAAALRTASERQEMPA